MVLRVHGVLRPTHGRQVPLSPFQPLRGRLPVLLCHSGAIAGGGEPVRVCTPVWPLGSISSCSGQITAENDK